MIDESLHANAQQAKPEVEPRGSAGRAPDNSPIEHATDALRESEHRLRLFIDQAPAAVAMFDTGMRYLAASRRWLSDYQLGDDVMGQCHYDVFHEVPERWKAVHARCLDGATERMEEDRYVRRDGTERWLRWEARPWRTADGAIGGIVLFTEDITERKIADEALRRTTERFDAALQAAPVALFSQDRSLVYTWVHRWLGSAAPAAVVGRVDHELLARRGDAENVGAIKRRVLDTGYGERNEVTLLVDGTLRTYDLNVQPQRDAQGEVVGITCAAVDVSDQKVMRANAEFLAELSEAFAPLASSAEVVRIAGERIYRHFGASRVNFSDIEVEARRATVFGGVHAAGLENDRLTHQLDAYFNASALTDLAAGHAVAVDDVVDDPRTAARAAEFVRWDVRALVLAPFRSDGRWKFLMSVHKSVPYTWRADEVALLNEVSRRVHTRLERARTEEALRAAHDTLYRLVEYSPFGVFVVDADFRLVQASAGALKALAATQAPLGQDLADILRRLWSEPVAHEALGRFRHTLATGDSYHALSTAAQGEGIAEYDWQIERLALPGGRLGVVCHFYDLSDSKRYESALREREERLRLSLRAASAESWDWDIAADRVVWLQENRNQADADRSTPAARYAEWLARVHPADRSFVDSAIRDAVEGRTPELSIEFRARTGDGSERWQLSLGKVLRDDAGRATRLMGISLDISDRKRGEEAAARLAAIVSASDDAVVSKTLDGIVQSWNGGAERIFGYSAQEMIGQSILRIIPPERREEEDRILGELRRGHRIEHYESVRVGKDGRRVDVSLSVFPIRDASGRPVAAAKVARDISARKRGEEDRQRREEEYRTLFEAAGTGNAELELETGRFLRVNRKYCELVGYTADELLGGKTASDITHPDDRAGGAGTDPLLHDGVSSVDFEKRYVRKEGSVIWVHVTATVLRDAAGRPYRLLGSVFDITQRKAAETALREEDRRKDEFLATLAHELRNPLAPVRNAVQLMKNDKAGATETTWARDVIDRQVERMARLIDDLLDVSRITLGKVELHLEPVDLARVLLDAVETSRPLIGADAHQLTVTLPPEPIMVTADTTRLSQVFANLLNNAAKFTGRGGRITLSAERAGDTAVVNVVDNGIGIPSDKLGSIFELFTQVRSDADDTQGGGLGIGLNLARRLVEMHGGAIVATSAGPGLGSTFTVRLPVAHAVADVPEDAADEGRASEQVVRSRVLVVDDNRDAAASLAMLLELAGHTVLMAFDGLEAVQVAETFQPDVILLDIGLPRLSGLDACRRIRALPNGDRKMIVAVTGWGQEADRLRAREAGFDDHMVKPVDPQVLMGLIADHARRRALETA